MLLDHGSRLVWFKVYDLAVYASRNVCEGKVVHLIRKLASKKTKQNKKQREWGNILSKAMTAVIFSS